MEQSTKLDQENAETQSDRTGKNKETVLETRDNLIITSPYEYLEQQQSVKLNEDIHYEPLQLLLSKQQSPQKISSNANNEVGLIQDEDENILEGIYKKYLNEDERKTLEKLQDNTLQNIEKYKDVLHQSSQKKLAYHRNSENSEDNHSEVVLEQLEAIDGSSSGAERNKELKNITFSQYKEQLAEQNKDERIQQQYECFDVRKLFQQEQNQEWKYQQLCEESLDEKSIMKLIQDEQRQLQQQGEIEKDSKELNGDLDVIMAQDQMRLEQQLQLEAIKEEREIDSGRVNVGMQQGNRDNKQGQNDEIGDSTEKNQAQKLAQTSSPARELVYIDRRNLNYSSNYHFDDNSRVFRNLSPQTSSQRLNKKDNVSLQIVNNQLVSDKRNIKKKSPRKSNSSVGLIEQLMNSSTTKETIQTALEVTTTKLPQKGGTEYKKRTTRSISPLYQEKKQEQQQQSGRLKSASKKNIEKSLQSEIEKWYSQQLQRAASELILQDNVKRQNQEESIQESKAVVSSFEIEEIEDLLIELEMNLTRNNGIINSTIMSNLQEYIQNKGQVCIKKLMQKKEKRNENSVQQIMKNEIHERIKKQLTAKGEQFILAYLAHRQVLIQMIQKINVKDLQELRVKKPNNLKTTGLNCLFIILATFNQFIPLVNNQQLKNQSWESSNELLSKFSQIFQAIQRLPQDLERAPIQASLLSEFERYFSILSIISGNEDSNRIGKHPEETTLLQLIYTISSYLNVLKEISMPINPLDFSIPYKHAEQANAFYLEKREEKIKKGEKLNYYLQKQVDEESKELMEKYGIDLETWTKEITEIENQNRAMRAAEQASVWKEVQKQKKQEKIIEKEIIQDEIKRNQVFIQGKEDLKKEKAIILRENKRNQINCQTENFMIAKKQANTAEISFQKDMFYNTIQQQEMKREIQKVSECKKKKLLEEDKVKILEARIQKSKDETDEKKKEKEEKIWARAQDLLGKQKKLLHERNLLLRNQAYLE